VKITDKPWRKQDSSHDVSKASSFDMHFNNDPPPDDVVSKLHNFIDLLEDYGK